MNKYKKLLTSSFILLLGSIGTKFGSLFLLPLYTQYLSTSEYGIADLTLTFVNLLLPILTLSIFEMFIKKIIETPSKRLGYFVSAAGILLITNVVVWLVSHMVYLFGAIHLSYQVFFWMLLLMTLQSFTNLILNYLRAINKNMLFALTNVFQTIALVVSAIVMIKYLQLGLLGYLLSNVISLIIILLNVFYIFKNKTEETLYFDRTFVKELVKDSLPLIPNALMWWGINSADKIFIVFFLGTSASGLFAAANKLPMFLTMLSTVFFQAWQVSAIEEASSEHTNVFYTNVFKYFFLFMELGVLLLTLFIKPICGLLLSGSFNQAVQYVPFLILATYFSNISSFFGANCIAYGRTKFVFLSSIICCAVNLTLSPIAISVLGLQGAGISGMLSFLLLSVLRFIKVKSFVQIDVTLLGFTKRVTLVIAAMVLFVFFHSNVPLLLLFTYVLWTNKEELMKIIEIGIVQIKKIHFSFK